MNITRRTCLLGGALGFTGMTWAQDYPQRPITLVVPYAAGALPDAFARALGQSISEALKQPVIVENRPGAGEVVAGSYVARAAGDGYTLMIATLPNVVAPSIEQKLPYRSLGDFAVVSEILRVVGVLAASPQVPAKTFPELVALMKANPGKLTYGTAGVGSPLHLMFEDLSRLTATKATHIPYKTFQGAVSDLVTGRIDYTAAPINMAAQYAKEGKLKIIGALSKERLADAPDILTLNEQMPGVSEFNGYISYAIVAPKGTPSSIIKQLNAAIGSAQLSPEFAKRVNLVGGIEVMKPSTPDQAAVNLVRDEARWRAVAKQANIQFE